MTAIVDPRRIEQVWKQTAIPVIVRPGTTSLRIRLPYAVGNREWLQGDQHNKPKWIVEKSRWETPKAWFNDLVKRAIDKYGKVYVIQPYRAQEKCAPACWNAEGHECQCSCMGANHGMGDHGNWLIISDTFATRWNEKEYACRLLTANKSYSGFP